MRAFITAIVLLFLILSIIIFNCIYTNKTVSSLLAALELAEDPASKDNIDHFGDLWKKSRGSLILSTNQNYILRIDALVNAMHICFEHNDISGYKNAVSLLRETLLEIKRFEELSLSNLI